jgi:hypothetical protein
LIKNSGRMTVERIPKDIETKEYLEEEGIIM